MELNNKFITTKIFISGKIESFNMQINKFEKIGNIRNEVGQFLNKNPENFFIEYNNVNIEDNKTLLNENFINLVGNNKMPYLKVFFLNTVTEKSYIYEDESIVPAFLERYGISCSDKRNSSINNSQDTNQSIEIKMTSSSMFNKVNITDNQKTSTDEYNNKINNKTIHRRNKSVSYNQKPKQKNNLEMDSIIKNKNKTSNKNIMQEYIFKREMKNMCKEIIDLGKSPIEVIKCSYFDPEKIKDYSNIENQLIFIETTINSLCANLIRLKENLISNLIIRKDFFDQEKKKNEKLYSLLNVKTQEFNREFSNLLNKIKCEFDLIIDFESETVTNMNLNASVNSMKKEINSESFDSSTKFYEIFNTIYELKLEKTEILKNIDKINTTIVNLQYDHNEILENLKKNLENVLSITNSDKEGFTSQREKNLKKTQFINEELEKKAYNTASSFSQKKMVLSFENITKINPKNEMKFNKEYDFPVKNKKQYKTKIKNLEVLNFVFNIIENTESILAYNIQTEKKYLLSAHFPDQSQITRFITGSKIVQISNSNCAFITGGFENNNGNIQALKKCFYLNLDANGKNSKTYFKLLMKMMENIQKEKIDKESDPQNNPKGNFQNSNREKNKLIKNNLNRRESAHSPTKSKKANTIGNQQISNVTDLDDSQCSYSGVYCTKNDEENKYYFNYKKDISIELLEMPLMNYGHWKHSGIIIEKKYLITVSGYECKKCEYLDFSSGNLKQWRNLPDLNTARMDSILFYFNENYLYCFGGAATNIHKNDNSTKSNNINSTKKKSNIYNVKKIERMKINRNILDKFNLLNSINWEYLHLFDNLGGNLNSSYLLPSMGLLQLNLNNFLLVGGEHNIKISNQNMFYNFIEENNKKPQMQNFIKNHSNNDLNINNDNNLIRLLTLGENGDFTSKILETKLKRKAKFSTNSNFFIFDEDHNCGRFYCFDSHNELCIVDIE